jgi:hypothetical protein
MKSQHLRRLRDCDHRLPTANLHANLIIWTICSSPAPECEDLEHMDQLLKTSPF